MTKATLSLSRLISSLLVQNNEDYSIFPEEEIKPTTIRLEPEVRKFCEIQALKLGISIQSLVAMVLRGVMRETVSPVRNEFFLMYERFFDLFKAHQIPLSHIPIILKDFKITASILSDKDKLLDAYSIEAINYLSQQFFVNKDWLEGTNVRTVPFKYYWNKTIFNFCEDLLQMSENGDEPRIIFIKNSGYLLDNFDKESFQDDDTILIVIRGTRAYGKDKHFYYFKKILAERWGDSQSRLQLKAIALFSYLSFIPMYGHDLPSSLFAELQFDSILLAQSVSKIKGITWRPDDYIDADEKSYPYPGSKTQGELFKVYEILFSEKLCQLLDKKIEQSKDFESKYKEDFFRKIKSKVANKNYE